MRVKQKTLEIYFNLLCKCLNKTNYRLNYIREYGGYQIVEKHPNSSESCPFGYERHSAKEMLFFLQSSCRAIKLYMDTQDNNANASAYWPYFKEDN